MGSLSYTSRAAVFLFCFTFDLYRGSFCYTSRAGFIFTQPMLASFKKKKIVSGGSLSDTSRAAFTFMW